MTAAQRALRACFIAVAGALAATVAHVAIDVAGDYLLARDAYDGLAHHSRALLLVGVLLTVLVVAVRAISAALRRKPHAPSPLAQVRGALVRPAAFVAGSALTAILILAAMESFDSALVGRIDDLNDVFGGSLVLGLSAAIAAGLLFGWLTHRLLRWLAVYERPIVAFILWALRFDTAANAVSAPPARDLGRRPFFSPLVQSQRRQERGPPAPAPA